MKFFCVLTLLFVCSCQAVDISASRSDFAKTERFYNSMIDGDKVDVALLNLFFTRMPKGGDIHHHYSGTIYAETYLDWLDEKGWFINQCDFRIVKVRAGGACSSLTASELRLNDVLYRKLLTLWSNKDYSNHYHDQPPPDANFFRSFDYFDDISDEYTDIGLQIIKDRAIKENVSYIETMFSRTGVKAREYFSSSKIEYFSDLLRSAKSQEQVDKVLDNISAKLAKGDKFAAQVDGFVKFVADGHNNIDSDDFVMRYQTYAVRIFDPVQVFLDLFAGYLAAEKSPLIVGVNIVAPENNDVSLRDYTLHMRMYNYLLRKYPNVGRSLHAGELTLGMVRPKDLTFHIWQARNIAKAQRIGHGIDLPYEDDSSDLLADLKENAVVEVNLTSNEFILGVEGSAHPYLIYSKYGVPMVISTDDSGVSRNNLTGEYVKLASRYRPRYVTIKEYVYNSIKYSFLSERDKTLVKKRLDAKFAVFEAEMAELFSAIR